MSAGVDGVDPHAESGELPRGDLGHPAHGELASAVGDAALGPPHAGTGGEVDDGPGADFSHHGADEIPTWLAEEIAPQVADA